jgi:2-oxoglutarate dehydrogenase complex dehydrogenase (E1) component-like enzyme
MFVTDIIQYFKLTDMQAAAIGTVLGAFGTKAIEKLLSRKAQTFNEATQLRNELRQELDSLKKEIEEIKKDAVQWQEKYWEQVRLNFEQRSIIYALQIEVNDLKKNLNTYIKRNSKSD